MCVWLFMYLRVLRFEGIDFQDNINFLQKSRKGSLFINEHIQKKLLAIHLHPLTFARWQEIAN